MPTTFKRMRGEPINRSASPTATIGQSRPIDPPIPRNRRRPHASPMGRPPRPPARRASIPHADTAEVSTEPTKVHGPDAETTPHRPATAWPVSPPDSGKHTSKEKT